MPEETARPPELFAITLYAVRDWMLSDDAVTDAQADEFGALLEGFAGVCPITREEYAAVENCLADVGVSESFREWAMSRLRAGDHLGGYDR